MILGIVYIILFSKLVGVHSGALEEIGQYGSCKGKSTGHTRVATEVAPHVADCTLSTSSKYCQYRCIMMKVGIIDKNNEISRKGLDEFAAKIEEFDDKKKLADAFYECGTKNKLTTRDSCATTRKLIYCTKNEANRVCKYGNKELDPDQSSEEKSLLGDVAGGIL